MCYSSKYEITVTNKKKKISLRLELSPPPKKFILGCGAENLFPQSFAEWGQNKKCSHRKNVKFALKTKPKTLTVRYYRADLIVASDYTLSNCERTLLQYSKDPPFCHWFPMSV